MSFWSLFIGLGDSALAILLALGITLALFFQRESAQAARWILAFGTGALIIAAGKLAFDFFGWSIERIDMYVISGHAMLSAAVYPMLFGALTRSASPRVQLLAIFAGLAIAAAMAVVLVLTRQHTLSETLLGSLVGLAVAFIGLYRPIAIRLRPALLLVFAPVLCLTLLNVSSPVHAARESIWRHAGAWFGVSGEYVRYIDVHPQSGEPAVVVIPPRKRPLPSSRLSGECHLGHAT